MRTAVLIPCYNEALTIARVVGDFRRELPEATVYVYDNDSTDDTAELAAASGAVVRLTRRRGKGAVVRAMFREVEADVYLMVDGDDTYPASSARALVDIVASGRADMAVGDRRTGGDYSRTRVRRFHTLGNMLVTYLLNLLFRARLSDIMSGYRAFNRTFVKSCPVLLDGFEVETLMTLHALDKLFTIAEVPVGYRDRPAGSGSKLSTLGDGFRVLRAIVWVFKDSKPLIFFLFLSALTFLVSLLLGAPVVAQAVRAHHVSNLASAVLATGVAIIGAVLLACGLVLDTIVKIHREDFEVQLLNRQPPEGPTGGSSPGAGRPGRGGPASTG